jgi:hypothetical protein
MLEALFVTLVLALGAACGSQPDPYQTGPARPPDEAFAAVKPVVDRACGSCHNGQTHPVRFDSAARFKTAEVRRRLETGQMPPGGRISASDKETLLAYLR